MPQARIGGRLRAASFAGALLIATAAAGAADAIDGFDFRREAGRWTVLGEGATLDRSGDRLDFRYRLGPGQTQLLHLPIPAGSLAGAQGLSFQARSGSSVSLVISLEEQGGGRWSSSFTLPKGDWTPVLLRPEDFTLSGGADAPADANGRLDFDRVRSLTLVDAASFIAAGNAAAMDFFGLKRGERRIELRDAAFLARSPGSAAGGLDGLRGAQAGWLVFGVDEVDFGRRGPLRENGLQLKYERKIGRAMSLIRPLPAEALRGAQSLTLELASREEAELTVVLEQSDGGKFETKLKLADGGKLRSHTLRLADFKRAGDSKTSAERPEGARVSQLLLVEAAGLFSKRGDNALWLAGLSTAGGAAVADGKASPPARPAADGAATVTVESPGWSAWTKRIEPVHSGPYSAVGDPTVWQEGEGLRMVYNCFDIERKRGAICLASSSDGLRWTDVPTGDDKLPGRLIKTRPGQWDDAQETPFMFKWRGEYLLYFIGYKDKGGFFASFPAHVGLAVSKDGVRFERPDTEPVLKTTPGGFDGDSISSPSLVEHEGKLVMLYSAYCFSKCPPGGAGVTLLAATSTDGRNWTKHPTPILTKKDFPHAKEGIAEAEVRKGPDGQYYLFYSLLYGDKGHEVGLARAPSPFGPWEINPQPVLRKSAKGFDAIGPIAPTVVFEGERVRMWFHGFGKKRTIDIGYAEAPWPLKP